MHATLKNQTAKAPALDEGSVVGRHLACPAGEQARHFEGGLRTVGKYKRRGASGGKPLVTIITVCRNSASTLEQCFHSVFRQTYENIEYLVIDGASTDGTLDVIRKHEHALDYCVSEPDEGLYQAMNKGLSLAAGDYILALNSDDWYAADCVASLVKAMEYGCADFVSALAQYVDKDGKPVELMRRMPFDDSALIRMPLRHETMLLSAAIYNDIGAYDESYRVIADFHLTGRLYRAGYSLYEIPRPLLFFRNNGISNSDEARLIEEQTRLAREHFPLVDESDARLLAAIWKLVPEQLAGIAARYPGEPRLDKALRSYYRYRRRSARAAPWKDSAIAWPIAAPAPPLVSVILPFFNAREYLEACMESVLTQSLASLELICIDDGSTDDSREIVERRRARDPRVILLANDRNAGPGASRNRGIRHARGSYVFLLDSDDAVTPGALEALYAHATTHDCDIVRGAYQREQALHGQKPQAAVIVKPGTGSHPIPATRLAETPELLRTTEGHWSCLYQRELISRVPYPVDLRLGEDSLFLVRALALAERIGVIGTVVYRYQANPESAINTFSFAKSLDSLEWRRRAWHVLRDHKLEAIGDRLIQAYWSDEQFRNLGAHANPSQLHEFFEKFREMFSETGKSSLTETASDFLQALIPLILEGRDDEARGLMSGNAPVSWMPARNTPGAGRKPAVATFCSWDHGGAGTGSLRRVAALRARGIDARIFSLVVKSKHSYVHRIVPELPDIDTSQQGRVWEEVTARAVQPVVSLPGYRARELFSLAASVLDFHKLKALFDAYDVVHLHWVVGMLDYEHMGEVLADKPVVWTLADMNAFTGGCHYAEGCEEFKRECRRCPLLGGESDLAHETWKIKKRAYAGLRNLHVVCPSPWMAEQVRASSLLGDREVHYIPNAFPVSRLPLTAKVVARIRLGLPLRKKLLLFGADNLSSHRKGGDMLAEAIERFCGRNEHEDVEVVVFGSHAISLPLPVRRLGYVPQNDKLALTYSAADAYLFASREDNAPLTVGESLLCGTPVVAFPVGNVPSVVEHGLTGYIAKFADADDFARGIEWALDASPAERYRRSAQCRIRATAFHDPQVAAARHEELYRQVLQHQD